MASLLSIVFFGALAGLLLGLRNPRAVLPIWPSREGVACVYGGVAAVAFVLFTLIPPTPQVQPPQQEAIAPSPSPSPSVTPTPAPPDPSPSPTPAPSQNFQQGDPIEKLLAIADSAPGLQAEYAALLDVLDPICLEERIEIGHLALDASGVASSGGVPTTSLEALQGLEKVVTESGAGEADCEEVLYSLLRLMGVE